MALFSWTTLSIVVIIVYLFVATQKMIELMNPLHGVNVSMFANTIDPHWQENQKFSMVCYLSLNSKPAYDILRDNGKKGVILWQKDDLKYQILQSELTKEIKLLHSDSLSSTTFKPDNESNFEISPKFWKIIRSNQSTVYLHVLVSADDSLKSDSQPHTSVLYGSVKLIKYDRIPKSFRHRYLLSDFGWVNIPESESMKSRMPADTIISYWKPEVAIKLVTDFSKYPYEYLPESLRKHVFQQNSDHLSASTTSTTSSVNQKQLKYYYKPPIHVDEIGLTTDKYIPLNNTVSYLPLKLSYSSMSLERWLLMQQMEHSLSEQKSFGFTDKDIDDVRRLISDTSVYLLGFTIVASLLHLLFEFLAFQSDISFWKENKSLAGLSTRAVVTDLFSQIIVFLYLIDSDTSVLVTIPAFFGIGIQAWKV